MNDKVLGILCLCALAAMALYELPADGAGKVVMNVISAVAGLITGVEIGRRLTPPPPPAAAG